MESKKTQEDRNGANVTQLVQSWLQHNPDDTERLGPDFFKFVLTQHTHAHFKYVESTIIPHVPGRRGEK